MRDNRVLDKDSEFPAGVHGRIHSDLDRVCVHTRPSRNQAMGRQHTRDAVDTHTHLLGHSKALYFQGNKESGG